MSNLNIREVNNALLAMPMAKVNAAYSVLSGDQTRVTKADAIQWLKTQIMDGQFTLSRVHDAAAQAYAQAPAQASVPAPASASCIWASWSSLRPPTRCSRIRRTLTPRRCCQRFRFQIPPFDASASRWKGRSRRLSRRRPAVGFTRVAGSPPRWAGAAAPKSRGCGRSRPTTMSRAIGTIPGHARSEEEIWTHA